jgi:hypothetical protein
MLQFAIDNPPTGVTPLYFTGEWTSLPVAKTLHHQRYAFSPTDVVYQLSPTRPSLYDEFIAHHLLDQITELPDYWDGYGALLWSNACNTRLTPNAPLILAACATSRSRILKAS